jgi:hypothetical protein
VIAKQVVLLCEIIYGFSVEHYADDVAKELLWALEGLVEEE